MDIQNNSSSALTPIVQWHCHGADNQLWRKVFNPYNPSMFRLQSKLNPTLCASFPFGQTNMATAECDTAFWFYRD